MRTDDLDWEALEKEFAEYEENELDDEIYNDFTEFQQTRQPESVKNYADLLGDNDIVPEVTKVAEEEEDEKFKEIDAQITDEDVEKEASKYFPEKSLYRSMLLDIFTPEQVIEIEKIQRTYSITNNQKIDIFKEKLKEWGKEYSPLGGGTNRYGVMMDGYVIKLACDADGKIDNQREFIYSIPLQPYVIKCYECYKDGLIAVFEYVEIFTIDDFWKSTGNMKRILKEIASNGFLIGDVGIDTKNYVNWGFRDDGSCVILDYAYIYSVKFNKFECGCVPGASLYYDSDFNNLICNVCGKKRGFKEIRKRISRKDQEIEIGDLTQKGYVLNQVEEYKKFNPHFVEGAEWTIRSKMRKDIKKRIKKLKNDKEFDYSAQPMPEDTDEYLEKLDVGYYNEAIKKLYNIK